MKLKPVRTITFKGKVLVFIVQTLFRLVHAFKGKNWQYPLPDFEENPLTMTESDAAYLGYKYYLKPHTADQPESNVVNHFRKQQFNFETPGFQIKETISLHAGGDLMPYKIITTQSSQHLWDETGSYFFDADIVFANLETPIKKEKPLKAVPEVMLYDMYFNGTDELFHIFSGNGKYKGYDVLSIANNHSMDMGKKGLLKTMEYLRDKKIPYCGGALNEKSLHQFPILERKGIHTAFLAYTYSLNKLTAPKGKPWMVNHLNLNKPDCDLSLIKEQCKRAREKNADMVVVSLHAGNAYQAYPSAHITQLYHRIFSECGPDIILGSHPHNAQPMEQYEFIHPQTGNKHKGFAIYSLADFVAYDIFTWCHMPVILDLKISLGTLNGKRHVSLTDAKVLPIFNYYNKQTKELRFIPLQNAIAQKHTFNKRTQQELAELEHFCFNHFLPEKYEQVLKVI